MDDEAFRRVAADSMAQGFVVEILLSQYLKMFEPESRQEVAETLVQTGRRTDHFGPFARGDEALAELFSDVAVRMPGQLERLVESALQRAAVGRR